MDVISLLVSLIIFAVVAYGVWWVCVKFGMPPPVLWLAGGILLIIMLYYLARQFGVGGPMIVPSR